MVGGEVGPKASTRHRLWILSKKEGSHQRVSDGDTHDLSYKKNHSSCYVVSILRRAKVEAEIVVSETLYCRGL